MRAQSSKHVAFAVVVVAILSWNCSSPVHAQAEACHAECLNDPMAFWNRMGGSTGRQSEYQYVEELLMQYRIATDVSQMLMRAGDWEGARRAQGRAEQMRAGISQSCARTCTALNMIDRSQK
jgi:hypothetical protein